MRNHYLAEFSPQALRRERGKVEWLSERGEERGSPDSNRGYTALDTGSNYGNKR